MAIDEPVDREARVSVDLLNQTPYRECAGGSYGDEEADYSSQEINDDDKDVHSYYDSLRPTNVEIKSA